MKSTAGRLLVLLTLASVGCSDDGSGPAGVQHPSGAITFDYLGPRDGSFSAVGAIRLDDNGDPMSGEWAAGAVSTDDPDSFGAVGFDLATGDRGDIFLIGFEGLEGPGTFDFDGTCTETSQCPFLLFAMDTTLDGVETDVAWLCSLDIGTATVTELSADRLAGTFSGAGACLSATSFQVIVVSNGTFNVPIVDEYSIGDIS